MVALTGRVPSSYQVVKGSDEQFNLSQEGGLLIAQYGSPYEYYTRLGRRYCASGGTHAGIASVQAVPTTAAAWVLYNPRGNTRDFVVDAVFTWSVSGTVGLGIALMVAVALGDQTTPPTDVALSIKSALDGGPFDSKAIIDVSHTITGGTPAWSVVASRDHVSAVSVGSGLRTEGDFPGSRVIKPGRELAATVLAANGTAELFAVGFEWHEVDR